MASDNSHHNVDATALLKVLDAYTRDIGRNIARIDHVTLDSINANVGDVIEVKGKKHRATVARCLPLYPPDEGKAIIRIDALTRSNAGVDIGHDISVRKVKVIPAERVILAPLEAIPPIDERHLADALEGIPIAVKDNVIVPYFGGSRLIFKVLSIAPTAVETATSEDFKQESSSIRADNDDSKDNQSSAVAFALIIRKTHFNIVREPSSTPINLNINEYVRQEPAIGATFTSTGAIENNTADNSTNTTNTATPTTIIPFFLGFRIELTCAGIAERIDYQIKLSKEQAEGEDVSRLAQRLAQKFIDLAHLEVKAANEKLVEEVVKGDIIIPSQQQEEEDANRYSIYPVSRNEEDDKEIRKRLHELKYDIIRKWIEEMKPG